MDNLNLLEICHLDLNFGLELKDQVHNYNELIVLLDGKLYISSDTNKNLLAIKNNVLLYPAGCTHSEHSETLEVLYIKFSGYVGKDIIIKFENDLNIVFLTHRLLNARRKDFSLDHPLCKDYFNAIMSEFAILPFEINKDNIVKRVQNYMFKSVRKRVTLDELAQSVNLSKYHFSRVYREKTGNSPMADFKHIRLEEAKKIISVSAIPLKLIAHMTGFQNIYHFSREFKIFTGFTPKEFRKMFNDEV